MLGLDLAKFAALITTYGYFMIFPIAVIEGPRIGVFSGFLVSVGLLNGYIVFLLLLIGDLVGDIIYYEMGRWGREGFLIKWGKYFGASSERIERIEKYYHEHHWKILAFAKTQPIGSVFLISAGAVKVPYGKYIWYNTLGSVPKVLIFELIGYYFGNSISKVGYYIDMAAVFSFLAAIFLGGAYFFYRNYAKKQTENI